MWDIACCDGDGDRGGGGLQGGALKQELGELDGERILDLNVKTSGSGNKR